MFFNNTFGIIKKIGSNLASIPETDLFRQILCFRLINTS